MAETFEIGEVAIFQNAVIDASKNGLECTVIGELRVRHWVWSHTGQEDSGMAYRIQWPDGYTNAAYPNQLRKRRPPEPPRQEVGDWELCPWQPKQRESYQA